MLGGGMIPGACPMLLESLREIQIVYLARKLERQREFGKHRLIVRDIAKRLEYRAHPLWTH